MNAIRLNAVRGSSAHKQPMNPVVRRVNVAKGKDYE
jgi:hypothetical protein